MESKLVMAVLSFWYHIKQLIPRKCESFGIGLSGDVEEVVTYWLWFGKQFKINKRYILG